MTHSPVTLITGCSSGIGRALATEYKRRGCTVFATARSLPALSDLAAQGIETLRLDVTDPQSIEEATSRILDQIGRIDLLVNNAGYGQIGPLMDISPDQLRAQFETNVIGQIAVIHAVTPHMIAQRSGSIVNISSVSGIIPTPFASAYAASKSALTTLSEALRMELKPFGIKVITVQPGGVKTQFGTHSTEHIATPANSVYALVKKNIHERAVTSEHGAAKAHAVAKTIAKASLSTRPPHILRTGRGAHRYPAYKRWIPSTILDKLIMKRFGLNKL